MSGGPESGTPASDARHRKPSQELANRVPTEQPQHGRLCPECEQWHPDTSAYFHKDYRTCKRCQEQRKLQQRRLQKSEAVRALVKQPDQLKSTPLGEEILQYAVQIMGGPYEVAKELVAILNESQSAVVRKDILKLIITGSIAAAKGKPKADASSMSNEELQEAIEAKLLDIAEKKRQRDQALQHGTQPGTNDPGLQPTG